MSDLIDRQEAIDALARIAREKFNLSDEYNHYLAGLMDGELAIKNLPTIQPERTEERTEMHACDLISRKATINAVNNAFDRETLLTGFVRSIALRAIRDMPTIQPEPHKGHWIRRDCGFDVECKCSVCGYRDFVPPHDTYWFKRNFCPNCGYKMEVEHDSDLHAE